MGIEPRIADILSILLYLGGTMALGIYFSRRNTTTEEYFLGGRSFPGWAIGISLMGTSISSTTFIAFPAAAYVLDWRQLVSTLTIPLVGILAILFFIPLFRRSKLTSAFEYLGMRFGKGARLFGAISFLLLQCIRIAKVLFLVAIPVSILSGIQVHYIIIVLGVFVAFYTILGGIDAVIWTDVVQAIVLIGGGLLAVIFIVIKLPDGLQQIFEIGDSYNKFSLGRTQWNINERTFWTVLMLGAFNSLVMFSSDQNNVQRYVASKSTKEARKSVAIFSLISVPTWTLFFFIGTCVFVFFKTYPEPIVGTLEAEQVFPYFIFTKLPPGVSGIIIAGAIAAGMSSLDSGINAIATVTITDIYKPFVRKGKPDCFYLKKAKLITVIVSMIMVGGGLLFSKIEMESMNDLSWTMASLFTGCIAGIFMIGFFTERVGKASVSVAIILSVLLNIYLGFGIAGWLPERWVFNIHSYYVTIIVNMFFIAIAYFCSFLFRKEKQNVSGLTVWSR